MYQGKVRVRAVGLLFNKDGILLLKHKSIGPDGYLWAPPGGGVDFGTDAEDTLIREFKEETNLIIEVKKFLFVNEHIDCKHHALELFFHVEKVSGEPKLGTDPELEEQILTEIKYFDTAEIRQLPSTAVHSMFTRIDTLKDMLELSGYYKFAQL